MAGREGGAAHEVDAHVRLRARAQTPLGHHTHEEKIFPITNARQQPAFRGRVQVCTVLVLDPRRQSARAESHASPRPCPRHTSRLATTLVFKPIRSTRYTIGFLVSDLISEMSQALTQVSTHNSQHVSALRSSALPLTLCVSSSLGGARLARREHWRRRLHRRRRTPPNLRRAVINQPPKMDSSYS